MTDITLIDHNEETLALLPTQFVDKPIIEALLKTWLDMSQELEQDFFDIETKTFFKVAEGVQLDRYGNLLEAPRIAGQTDEEFRLQLVEQIMKRSSDATPDRIREIIEATTALTNTRLFEHFIGSIFIYGVVPEEFDLTLVHGASIANIVKAGATASSTEHVLGVTKNHETLWIPSEIITELTPIRVDAVAGDDDFLETDLEDFISVSEFQIIEFVQSDNAKLAEGGGVEEDFVVESDGDNNLLVQPPDAGQNFHIEIIDPNFPFSSSHGVLLEINQFELGDTL